MHIADLSIGRKIGLACAVLVFLGALGSAVGIFVMAKIGSEIEEIAEQDIPLTGMVTKLTLHQLEQAILTEKGAGALIKQDTKSIAEAFATLGKKVHDEIVETERMLEGAIANAHSSEAKQAYQGLLAVMGGINRDQQVYEAHGEEIFALIEAGKPEAAAEIMATAEAELKKIDRELIEAVTTLQTFTAESARTAEADEKAGILAMTATAALLLVLGMALTIIVSRSISRPLLAPAGVMKTMAGGERQIVVPGTAAGDETGVMAKAVETFRLGLIEADRLTEEQRQAEAAKAARADRIMELNAGFDRDASEILEVFAAASEELRATAQSMSASAEEAGVQAATVAGATQQTSNNIQTVAAATEELAITTQEITRQISQSAGRVEEATKLVNDTDRQVASLADEAGKIEEIISLIEEIADQTNLLALNATIEAARAGDAGKGFAVVAAEVKDLANQTQRATQDINQQIAAVQTETGSVVTAIQEVNQVIGQINEVSQSIASAVEEQNAATAEITRNVEQAAQGSQEVSANVVSVSEVAADTGRASTQVLAAAEELTIKSTNLRGIVGKYLEDIEAA